MDQGNIGAVVGTVAGPHLTPTTTLISPIPLLLLLMFIIVHFFSSPLSFRGRRRLMGDHLEPSSANGFQPSKSFFLAMVFLPSRGMLGLCKCVKQPVPPSTMSFFLLPCATSVTSHTESIQPMVLGWAGFVLPLKIRAARELRKLYSYTSSTSTILICS